jgi:uncharacterized protein with LGFP repeats
VWKELGGANGLGQATHNEADAAPSPFGTRGRYQVFQNGLIIWDANGRMGGQAFGVWGGILNKYLSIGGTRSYLGFPLSSEKEARPSPFGAQGRFNQFENGYIVWHRNGRYANQSFIVQGAIATLYNSLGGSASYLGMPISDEMDYAGGRRSVFEGGSIVWSAQSGARVVRN